jgi:hypothetical protein
MSKFNLAAIKAAISSPVTTERAPTGRTHEGGDGYQRDTKSALFLLAVSTMVGEHTFYESAEKRDQRYADLVHTATLADPEWTARFLQWLRTEGNMRSASLVGAAEFTKARLEAGLPGQSRQVIGSVLQRADEPGEMLAYWTSVHGRNVPKPVKRGIADAAKRLYNERSFLKYDSDARGYRFGDVLNLTHPDADGWQADLFRYALDVRHGNAEQIPDTLRTLRKNAAVRAAAADEPEVLLDSEALRDAGMTWENALSLAGSTVDKGRLWEALIPSMGYMALLRNLRNFDQAGVSDEVAARVAERLADPEQVAKSRQFPFRFLSAYRAAPSLRWGHALDRALSASLANVPALGGRTLIVLDRSPSMFPGYQFSTANKSDITLADQAAVFGCALALRAEKPTVVVYGGTSRTVSAPRAGSLLKFVDGLGEAISYTDTAGAVRSHYARHDRVLIVTDEQSATADAATAVPGDVPVYVWNVGGYRHGNTPSGHGNRHTFGGLTDAAFRMVPLLEAGRNADWPF